MCLAQGHNTLKSVKLELLAPLSRVKLSTTEPLRSPILLLQCEGQALPNAREGIHNIQKPAPGPEVITSLVLNSTEHGVYTFHKCKETVYLKLESFSMFTYKLTF